MAGIHGGDTPTTAGSAICCAMSASVLGFGVRQTEDEKKGCWNVAMPVMERSARGGGVRWWWATRVAMKNPGLAL